MIHNEGYIKFSLEWDKSCFEFPDKLFQDLIQHRKKLFDLGLIGMFDDGIGFGNISVRYNNTNQFIISGSATGALDELKKEHFSLVTQFDIQKNSIYCIGSIAASSESMSHAAIYQSNKKCNAVIHVHHKKLWETFLDLLPTTDKKAAYGTPEIAIEMGKRANENEGMLIMGGHEEGIIAFGSSLQEASKKIIKLYKTLKND